MSTSAHHLDRRIAGLPLALHAGLGFGSAMLALLGVLSRPSSAHDLPIWGVAATAVSFLPLGVFLLRRLDRPRLGRLLSAIGALATVATIATCWSHVPMAFWASQWMWWPPLALLPLLLLVVPDGELPSRLWRAPFLIVAGAAVVSSTALAAAAAESPMLLIEPSTPTTDVAEAYVIVAAVGVAVSGVGMIAAGWTLGLRWWRAEDLQRRQLACLAPAAILLAVGAVLDGAGVEYAWLPAVGALPAGLTIAVLHGRLHDLDLAIHRGLVGLIFSATAVVVVIIVAPTAGRSVGGGTGLVVTALTTLALLPALVFVRRAVAVLLYGRRHDPYGLLTDLGRRTSVEPDPLRALAALVEGVVSELRLPYAAICDLEGHVVAEEGRWTGEPKLFSLSAQGRSIGQLRVTPRREGERLNETEQVLLRDLADRAAVILDSAHSAVALRRARERLVLVREEERQRLRRDLHDGVASALTGSSMLLAAARRKPASESAVLLDALVDDLRVCSSEVRSLIDGLRPAALDEGLATALRHLATCEGTAVPAVSVEVPEDLGALAPAVEVAAYRIACEAVTNVRKHAAARCCHVTVERDPRHLVLRIVDDGRSTTRGGSSTEGVGLASIRTRAEELGGRSSILFGPNGGRVEVLLPASTEATLLTDTTDEDYGRASSGRKTVGSASPSLQSQPTSGTANRSEGAPAEAQIPDSVGTPDLPVT